MKFIDLSVSIDKNMPLYPGDPKTIIKQSGLLQKDGYVSHYISMLNHSGTHVDAPSHMIKEGKTLDQYPIETFTGRGIYIPVINQNFDLSEFKKLQILRGDIVLLHTNMCKSFNKPEYFKNNPAVPKEVAQYLVQRKIKMVGIDAYSLDHEQFIAHKIFLNNDILILENLRNLEKLKDAHFTIYAFPLKIALDGSPVRVIAAVD